LKQNPKLQEYGINLQKGGKSVPVPVHGRRELGIGLIRRIEKQTGVKLT